MSFTGFAPILHIVQHPTSTPPFFTPSETQIVEAAMVCTCCVYVHAVCMCIFISILMRMLCCA